MFGDPRWLPLVYHRKADKGPSYRLNDIFGVQGVLRHQDHVVSRRRLAPSFTGTAMQGVRPLVESLIDEWIDALSEKADGKPFDFPRYTPYLTYDVLANLCFGESLGFVRDTGNCKLALSLRVQESDCTIAKR
jgi:cytochrome P450